MNLPRGQHPGTASFFELRNALADRFRLEGTAVLKIIDQRRNCHRTVVIYLAVTYSAVKFIHFLNLFYFLFPKIPANLKLCIRCHFGIFFFRQYLF